MASFSYSEVDEIVFKTRSKGSKFTGNSKMLSQKDVLSQEAKSGSNDAEVM